MKKYLLGGIAVILSILVISCSNDDDGYSLDNVWVSFGIVDNSQDSYSIKLDNGDYIYPLATNINLSQFVDSSRVLVNYTVLGEIINAEAYDEYNVKINSMKDILMKGILDITEENKDSIGNDPIIVQNAWITNNLLNFELKYWGDHKIHFINLVKQPGELTEEGQPFELELRHNSNGDSDYIPYVAYVSFDLSSLQLSTIDSVKFNVTATDYDGKIYNDDGVYNYNDN
jgi:hypothetical protein